MDERKRPRLELVTTGAINCGTAQAQSIFLSQSLAEDIMEMGVAGVATSIMNTKATTTTATNALPANVFLTICDDTTSESQTEFITINGSCIKSESEQQQQHQQQQQQECCLLQQQQQTRRASTVGMNVGLSAINAQTAAALLPASVQLPRGCEIYLVKEYVEPPPLTPTNASRTVISTTTTTNITTTTAQTTIAITTTATNTIMTTNAAGKNSLQIVRKHTPQAKVISQNSSSYNNNNNNNNNCLDIQDEQQRSEFDKQSELLEAYKKRDDKRRATHNEVERRRRDKINSWIFKLKEMLPAEIPNYTAVDSEACNNNSNSNSSTSDQQGQATVRNICRNLPCDSKSQILIKACEYIKAMQLEIKSLRECLSETEHLRERNERLQTELQNLKHEQLAVTVLQAEEHIVDDDNSIIAHCNGHLTDSDDAVDGHVDDLAHNINSNPNSNFNVTLNSLNSLAGNGDSIFMPHTATNHHNLVAVMDGKRELLMRDFVD